MDVQENCIQLKIDRIISDINLNNQDNQNEEKNQITALMGYSHCLDLFDFLQIFSKIQKNELLVQAAIIYDSIGYTELSMNYINESLILIPNVPSIILYKSGLFASLNKLDEAQKWLIKYKYLIGENLYDNYIHDSYLVVLYYLMEYEEYIILRKIDSIENKYNEYAKENAVLFFIKSKILEKLAHKIKNSDKKRYISYVKEIEEIKYKYINKKKNESDFLLEQGVRNETITKLLILINPNLLNYKPKQLIEYKQVFNKSGFSLFYTLLKICKIIKLKIEVVKYFKMIIRKKKNNENKTVEKKNTNNLNDIIKSIIDNNSNISNEENIKNNQQKIKNLCKNIWLHGYLNQKKNKNIDIKNLKQKNSDIKSYNYYIHKGYYSHLNLKEYILKNIEYNNNYKNNKLYDSFLDDIKGNEIKIILNDKNKNENNYDIKKEDRDNEDIDKISKKEVKNVDQITNSNKIKTKIIKNSLSDIIKKVITYHQKGNNKNKRNKFFNDDKESKKSNKFCSTDNCSNKIIISQNKINKKIINITKVESNSVITKKKDSNIVNYKNEKEIINKEIKSNENKKNDKKSENKENIVKKEESIQNEKPQDFIPKNNNNSNKNYSVKLINNKEKDREIKNINTKNKLLTSNTSNKKIGTVNINDQVKIKTTKKNIHNNLIYSKREDKKMDTDYRKYKDVREINLASYCLKQLIKKKENKNKNLKHKELANLTDKIELVPQKIIDFEKQMMQINEHKYIKSKSKKKKALNKSIKRQINTITFEKKMKKNNQKNSDNNLINNRSSYNNRINFNNNIKNLKKSINNYGNKKELSKFNSLNYLHVNFYSNNNYLNINFNNYMNYNFNYSNRHEDKKNFDFRFNQNSDNKKRESYPREKFSFRTINLDFKNMSIKLNNNIKKPLLNSFIDSKEKNKKSSDNKYDFISMPLNKIKNSPSSETNCLKKKIKKFEPNLINQKAKTSFAKYMLYNINKKNDPFFFSKSINTSEYNKYKNSSSKNKSKNMKSKYNKTITNKSNSKIINK